MLLWSLLPLLLLLLSVSDLALLLLDKSLLLLLPPSLSQSNFLAMSLDLH